MNHDFARRQAIFEADVARLSEGLIDNGFHSRIVHDYGSHTVIVSLMGDEVRRLADILSLRAAGPGN